MQPHRITGGFAAAASAAALLLGCAGSVEQLRNETLLPEIDVVQVKENSDEALKLAQEAKLDVEVLSTKLTEFDSKLVMLSDEVSDVSLAKIEEIEIRLSLLIEAFKDLQDQVSSIEVLPRVRSVRKKARKPGFRPSDASELIGGTPEYAEYTNALRIFNSRSYRRALELFTTITKKYPSGSYSDNCHYWAGECHYALGDYARAIASFKKVFGFSNSSKIDDAQLKISMSYLRMGKFGKAKAELKHLIDRYPASPHVGRAKKYLTEMQ